MITEFDCIWDDLKEEDIDTFLLNMRVYSLISIVNDKPHVCAKYDEYWNMLENELVERGYET